jgi:hypothetical protein
MKLSQLKELSKIMEAPRFDAKEMQIWNQFVNMGDIYITKVSGSPAGPFSKTDINKVMDIYAQAKTKLPMGSSDTDKIKIINMASKKTLKVDAGQIVGIE